MSSSCISAVLFRAAAVAGVAVLMFASASHAQSNTGTTNTQTVPGTNMDDLPRAPRASRGVIFFPPFPPPLDYPINRNPPGSISGNVAPPALAEYVSEIFYPQLSSQIHGKSLNEKQRQRLAEYRAAKHALLKELRDTLADTEEAEGPARRQALAALARRQAPQFAELEKAAEHLRNDLIAPDRNWSDFREWKLGDGDRRGYSPFEIAQVMRAYASYQKGLLPAQRRLLREISIDLAHAVETTAKTTAAQPHIFFSPSPARITLPVDLPAEIAAKVAAYQTKKSLLKKELYDTIYDFDGKVTFFNNPLRSLAAKQAPRLAELDALAEEIRVGLEPVATTVQPRPRSPLPTALAARSAELAQRRTALQRETSAQIEAIVARLRAARLPINVTFRFENDGLRFVAIPNTRGRGATPQVAEGVEKVREELAEIAEAYGRSLAEFINTRDELRREAGEAMNTKDPQAIDQALSAAVRAAAIMEDEDAYRLYRIAVLSPGLSPDQRCLLFDAAIEALVLPLPRGELQPNRRANSW